MKIKLFTRPNSKVGHKHIITGIAKGEVNAFILANDGLYYLQPRATRRGNKFEIACTFGFDEIPCDSGYEAWVVANPARPHSPQKDLPAGDKAVVRVWREK